MRWQSYVTDAAAAAAAAADSIDAESPTLPPGSDFAFIIFVLNSLPYICTVTGKKTYYLSLNNFNKFKRIFTIFGTHYFEDTFYQQHVKFAFEI